MLRYYFVLGLITCLFTTNMLSQVLPESLETLVTIDQKKLRAKKLVPKASQYAFFDLLMSPTKQELKDKYYLVEQLYQTPEMIGLNTATDIYLFADKVGDYMHQGVHFFITDVGLFEAAVDSLTQRERTRIGIPDNAPPALREALLKEQEKQDRFFEQFRPKPVPNSNYTMLKLQKATYVWTSDKGYIFQTIGLNEWQGVDEDKEGVAAKKFQEYKKLRKESKEKYIELLANLQTEASFDKEMPTDSDIVAWLSNNEVYNPLNNPNRRKSPQANPWQLLLRDMFAFADSEQTFTIDFEDTELLLQQMHRSRNPIPRIKGGSLPMTFLQGNQLLSIENQYITDARDWIGSMHSYLKSDALFPLQASETRLLHDFQKTVIDHIKTTGKGSDTIQVEVALPVFTSFLAIENTEDQAALLAHLVEEEIIFDTGKPNIFQSVDTSYTAQIVQHPKGIFWSMHKDIATPELQARLLNLIEQCPSAYKLVDMRNGIEALSMQQPVFYTSFYRTIKNNWKSSSQERKNSKGTHTNTIQLKGFSNTGKTSVDMFLEIVDSYFNQVQEEAMRKG